MKKMILSGLMLSLGMAAFAQDTEDEIPATRVMPPGMKKHELGISTQSAGRPDGVSMLGLQYKLWKDEQRAFRFFAGYGNFHTFNSSVVAIGSDSVTEVHSLAKANMPIVGFGLEIQRNFWRKVYFFAAVEMRGGYGGGEVDTMIHQRLRSSAGGPASNYGTPFTPQDLHMLYVEASPSIAPRYRGRIFQ